jgi:hypothetical protein
MPDALWHRRQVQALIDLGHSPLDAERFVTQAEQLSLVDGRLDAAQFEALATITDADIADARADWYASRAIPARYKRLLDAQVKVQEWNPDQPRDEQGRFGSGGGAGGSAASTISQMQARVDAIAAEEEAIKAIKNPITEEEMLHWSPEAYERLRPAIEAHTAATNVHYDKMRELEERAVDDLKQPEPASSENLKVPSGMMAKEDIATGLGTAQSIVGAGVIDGYPIAVISAAGRPYCTDKSGKSEIRIGMKADAATVAHEYGHAVEQGNPYVRKACQEFLARRTEGEPTVLLKDVTKNGAYGAEATKTDKFFNAYCGKHYDSGNTEIFSMGLERMTKEPLAFFKEDPDYFSFMVKTIEGAKGQGK